MVGVCSDQSEPSEPIPNALLNTVGLYFNFKIKVFGLHPNAEIGYYTQAARDLWLTLVELQPQTGDTGGGMSRDDFISQVASDIQKSLPSQFEMDKIKRRITDVTPTTVVLFQELERFNMLIKRMNNSLIELGRALIGEVGMSNELDDVAKSLFNGQFPSFGEN